MGSKMKISEMISTRKLIAKGANEVIQSNDDSMEPLIVKDTIQFIHWQPAPDFNGQTMAVRIKNGSIMYKKVYYEKGYIRLVSLNEKYADEKYAFNDIEILGKVIIEID